MCYSAQIWSDYKKYVRAFGADISIKDFVDLFWLRTTDSKVKIPKAMEAAFQLASTDGEREIRSAIDEFASEREHDLQSELFKQRERQANAERKIAAKSTKAALEDKRIATNKIERARQQIADLHRTQLVDSDSRIFPGQWAPVMVMENGRRVIKPMRYQCRPAGKPAFYDVKYPGTYNARKDSLGGFWKELFGYSHGVIVVNAFYENVPRHRAENRDLAAGESPENLVLEFKPRPEEDMLVACLWSRWSGPGEPDLLSFAAVTDDPPPEISIAGHDRCIVNIRPQNLDAWLSPDPSNLAALYAILDDRARPYYEHRMAA
jgi:putative SOS response-associated peptidase YedK